MNRKLLREQKQQLSALTTLFLPFVAIVMLLSCEETIDIDIPTHESQLVVEGWIESGQVPRILLTKSAPYFSIVDSQNIRNYIVRNATVSVTIDSFTDFCTFKPSDKYFPPFVYFANDIIGAEGKIYELTVIDNGNRYSAFTTIPEPVSLDSIWFELNNNSDSLGLIWIRFTDPLGQSNYYRTQTRRNQKDKDYVSTHILAYKEEYFDGQTMTLSLQRGKGNLLEHSDEQFYKIGDTVDIKFSTMNKPTYEFWISYQTEIISSSNPFSVSNSKIKSNIMGGYGIWGGYNSKEYRLIAKKNPAI